MQKTTQLQDYSAVNYCDTEVRNVIRQHGRNRYYLGCIEDAMDAVDNTEFANRRFQLHTCHTPSSLVYRFLQDDVHSSLDNAVSYERRSKPHYLKRHKYVKYVMDRLRRDMEGAVKYSVLHYWKNSVLVYAVSTSSRRSWPDKTMRVNDTEHRIYTADNLSPGGFTEYRKIYVRKYKVSGTGIICSLYFSGRDPI